MLEQVAGVRVGHWTGERTGVTVVVLPPGTVGAYEVRGGAPATRELAALDVGRLVQHVDAIVLSGGSAFGLAAADGVMRALAELGRGFPTTAGPVPIVPAAALFDLAPGVMEVPGPEEGRQALAAALDESGTGGAVRGAVGAGRSARVGKWLGTEHGAPGGIGTAILREGPLVVAALAAVNSLGDVLRADGTVLAGTTAPEGTRPFPGATFGNTTLVVVVTNACASRSECRLVAESAQHGLARAIHPSHTRFDGDVAFVCATGAVDAGIDQVRVLATGVVAEAVRDAVA